MQPRRHWMVVHEETFVTIHTLPRFRRTIAFESCCSRIHFAKRWRSKTSERFLQSRG